MHELFCCEVGLSDHTMGVGAAVAAVAHGVTVIEKHFTMDKSMEGWDHVISANPEDMKLLVDDDISPKLLNQDDFILVIENCGDNLDENNIQICKELIESSLKENNAGLIITSH